MTTETENKTAETTLVSATLSTPAQEPLRIPMSYSEWDMYIMMGTLCTLFAGLIGAMVYCGLH